MKSDYKKSFWISETVERKLIINTYTPQSFPWGTTCQQRAFSHFWSENHIVKWDLGVLQVECRRHKWVEKGLKKNIQNKELEKRFVQV